ncbi:MAG: hypothetical protein Q8K63_03180, partial [Acidimicrobiales bacterium]|nr:hypothetical protein [Acidimicrobiales bacterium]
AGLVVAIGIAGIAGPSDFADPDNIDFRLLEPTWLIALMLLVLTVLFGTTLGAVYEWLNERIPLPSRRPRALLAYLPLAPLALMPFNIALVGFAAIGGAATPETVRDVFRSRRFVRVIGTIAAAATAYLGVRLAINLASIAF